MPQTAIIHTATRHDLNVFFTPKGGSLISEEFYQLHSGSDLILFSLLLEKIMISKEILTQAEGLEAYVEALSFTQKGISLALLNPGDSSQLSISPCDDKTIHVGSFRQSSWAVPVHYFQEQVLRMLKKLHPYRDPTEILRKMTVRSVSKSNGVSFAKVGIQ
jgi:hypothetical protein